MTSMVLEYQTCCYKKGKSRELRMQNYANIYGKSVRQKKLLEQHILQFNVCINDFSPCDCNLVFLLSLNSLISHLIVHT